MTAAFPVVREGRPPQTMRFSEFYTRPGCTPVNASPERSPVQTHHSGPKLMANLYFVRLFHSLLSNDFADAPYSYSASPQFKQPSSTSTASLSTVRRGGLSTSTTKSEARHERMLCSCKLRLRRDEPDGRLTQRPSSSSWPPSASCRRGIFLASVGFMPSGHLLGLRRLHAVGAKVCSYRGHVAGLFFSAARRRKRTTGWGRSHERFGLTECDEGALGTTWTSRVTNRAVTTEPSPPAIGGQSSMAVTNASPEASSSGTFSGSIRPAQRPLSNIHERGRMISASTMPLSLRSTVIDTLAQVAWSGSGCGSTSKRLGFLVGTRDPIGTDSMGT